MKSMSLVMKSNSRQPKSEVEELDVFVEKKIVVLRNVTPKVRQWKSLSVKVDVVQQLSTM